MLFIWLQVAFMCSYVSSRCGVSDFLLVLIDGGNKGKQKVSPLCGCEYVAVGLACLWHGTHNGCNHGKACLSCPTIAEPIYKVHHASFEYDWWDWTSGQNDGNRKDRRKASLQCAHEYDASYPWCCEYCSCMTHTGRPTCSSLPTEPPRKQEKNCLKVAL